MRSRVSQKSVWVFQGYGIPTRPRVNNGARGGNIREGAFISHLTWMLWMLSVVCGGVSLSDLDAAPEELHSFAMTVVRSCAGRCVR
jgi:hypothetical protein